MFQRYVFVALLISCLPSAALAKEEGGVDLSANIGLVSDYRFRGVSLSDRDAAVQGGVDLALPSGWFVGSWASTIADYGGANVEVDIYAGHNGAVAGLDYSIGAYAYVYPGGHDVSYVELQGTLARTFGPATLTGELAYVPRQAHVDGDNVYLGARFEAPLPDTPLSVTVRGGYEDGFYDGKLDGEVGISWALEPLALSLSYVFTDHAGADEAGRLARDGALLSAVVSF